MPLSVRGGRLTGLLVLLGSLLTACGESSPQSHGSNGSMGAHLAAAPGGGAVLSYVQPGDAGATLMVQMLDERGWHAPRLVAADPQMLVNWADFPSVLPLDDSRWAAHWLRRTTGGTYSYDVMIARSPDGGQTWSSGSPPHDDGTATEHGFVSLLPTTDGVRAVWLDGRQMAARPPGPMQLRTGLIDELGNVSAPAVLDEIVCDCCQTDAAEARAGAVVVYRNRTADEIRDVYITREVAGDWLPGMPVAHDGWRISGCPVNGPAVDARSDQVAVAWFSAVPSNRVRLALSQDGGATFGEPVRVDDGAALGRVDVVLLEEGSAMVSWLAKGDGALLARRVSPTGLTGPIRTIAPMSVQRGSGFPQMLRVTDDLLFAWTDAQQESTQVFTRRVPVADFSAH